MHQLHLVFFEQQAPIIVLSFQIVGKATIHVCAFMMFSYGSVKVRHIFEQKHLFKYLLLP